MTEPLFRVGDRIVVTDNHKVVNSHFSGHLGTVVQVRPDALSHRYGVRFDSRPTNSSGMPYSPWSGAAGGDDVFEMDERMLLPHLMLDTIEQVEEYLHD